MNLGAPASLPAGCWCESRRRGRRRSRRRLTGSWSQCMRKKPKGGLSMKCKMLPACCRRKDEESSATRRWQHIGRLVLDSAPYLRLAFRRRVWQPCP